MRVANPALILALASASPLVSVAAAAPVAIVEEMSGHPNGIEPMDYLEAGAIIRLGVGESVVIGYLNSCFRETIRGGVVTIGAEQSEATAGKLERAKVDCEAGKMLDATGQSSEAAGIVVRASGGGGAPALRKAPAPAFTIFGLSPIFEVKGPGPLVVARLDAKGEYLTKTIEPKIQARSAFWDMADDETSLTPDGVYGVRWRGVLTVFKVDKNAKPGKTPVVGRLVRPPSGD